MHRRAGVGAALLMAATSAFAERLPIKSYAIADGLAHDTVNRIVQDSRGFLWFCTQGGLSRFDGYRFTGYTRDEGLPSNEVTDIIEARDGTYWIATSGGVVHFDPGARQRSGGAAAPPAWFTTYSLGPRDGDDQARCLLEHDGAIWAGAVTGLFRLEGHGSSWTASRADDILPPVPGPPIQINALVPDGHGGIWICTRRAGLFHRSGDGRTTRLTGAVDDPLSNIRNLIAEPDGTFWAATRSGVLHVGVEGDAGEPIVLSHLTARDGLPTSFTSDIFRARDGRLYVATTSGLVIAEPDGVRLQWRTIGESEGLLDVIVDDLAEDRNGNLWMGTRTRGAMKLAVDGFISYGRDDGLSSQRHAAFFESNRGDLLVMGTIEDRRILLSRFDGTRFATFRLNIPRIYLGWGWHQIILQDHLGEWWVSTGEGLFRFAATDDVADLARASPKARYRKEDGLGRDDVFRLFEDSRGDLWMVTEGLVRWDRASGMFHKCTAAEGRWIGWVGSFAEDRSGNLWMTLWGGNLLRHRDGRFTEFSAADGLPSGSMAMVHVDREGRLWVGTDEGGVARSDDPSAERPVFRIYSTRQGLAGNQVTTITEDRFGRIYLGTGHGVDRLDPETDRIKHFTTADGLLVNTLGLAYADRRGDLWFGSHMGVSKFSPKPDPPRPPPPIMISALRVAGAAQALSLLGETRLEGLILGPTEGQLEVEFLGLDYGPGEVLRYQYRLEGADAEWSAPSDRRSVNYANLAPGGYRFVVRAIDSAGQASPQPASVSFMVLTPVWKRWWFLISAGLVFAAAVAAGLRYRVARLIELERVRTRIATDLHDDIGASLSQIAILSEVTRRRADGADPTVTASLEKIASVSGELVDSMSDIVWAINPRRDRLSDLTQRMRWFASDLLDSRDIKLEFLGPEADRDTHLDADVRRQLYLVFKEALNNLVKHSGGSSARIELRREGDRIQLRVTDDGGGFDPSLPARGHGLASMRERARNVGGRLEVASRPGQGVDLLLEVPLVHRRQARRDRRYQHE